MTEPVADARAERLVDLALDADNERGARPCPGEQHQIGGGGAPLSGDHRLVLDPAAFDQEVLERPRESPSCQWCSG